MGSRETVEVNGITHSQFDPDDTCDNMDCECDKEETTISVTTPAEVDGMATDFGELKFCSVRCLNVFLDESFPITVAGEGVVDIQILEPDI